MMLVLMVTIALMMVLERLELVKLVEGVVRDVEEVSQQALPLLLMAVILLLKILVKLLLLLLVVVKGRRNLLVDPVNLVLLLVEKRPHLHRRLLVHQRLSK
jgi:hypothetical protein